MFYMKYFTGYEHKGKLTGEKKQTNYLTISSWLRSIFSCKGEDTGKIWVLGPDKYSHQLLFYNLSSEMTITGVSSVI